MTLSKYHETRAGVCSLTLSQARRGQRDTGCEGMVFPSAGGIICHLNLLLYTCLLAPKCLSRTHITFVRRKKWHTPKSCFHLGKCTRHHGNHESGDKKKCQRDWAPGPGHGQKEGCWRPAEAGKKEGARRRGGGREVLGEGDPKGAEHPLVHPAPYFSPEECHSPHPPLSLRGVDTWAVSREAAMSGPGASRGASQPHDLSTLNAPALLWTCLLVMPGMWMKHRRPFKFKFQVNNG